MKSVTAIVRTSGLEGIVKALRDAGIRGMTISEVKGIGEQAELFKPYTIHSRIDIFVPDEWVDMTTEVILRHGHTGLAGDGLIAVYCADYLIKIRTKERIDDEKFKGSREVNL